MSIGVYVISCKRLLATPLAIALVLGLFFGMSPENLFAWSAGSPAGLTGPKLLYRGSLPPIGAPSEDGAHTFHIRIFSIDGSMIHDEVLDADVRDRTYSLLLGSHEPLSAELTEEYEIGVSVDGGIEMRSKANASSFVVIRDALLTLSMDQLLNPTYEPLEGEHLTAASAERLAMKHGKLFNPIYGSPTWLMLRSPLRGLYLEMSIAPPEAANQSHDIYQLAKYGRLAVEFNNFARIDGNRFGLAAQALHVAHHLLFYSAGITSDINNDGMFLMSAGLAHYQTGNSRFEPFVDAPFMRVKFQSSREAVFAYSELETTMHYRSYVSGTVGIGFSLTPFMRVIGGFHHTEFVMPTEHMTREVNGVQGIISWGM
jgi:hypothetical protein